jgi:AAA domain/Homeodomain-like domain
MDGMPRLSNVGYYAKIVKEKSRLRQIVYETQRLQNDALAGYACSDDIASQMESFSRQPTKRDNPAVIADFHELPTLQLPEPKWLVEPLLTRGGTMMLYSWPGWGKSYIATELAFSLAAGSPAVIFGGHQGPGGAWPLHGPCRTLYLYGEMHGSKIRERIIQIAKGHHMAVPEKGFFGVMSKDYQLIPRASQSARTWRPSISTGTDRRYVEERLFSDGYELLVLDNISTLWSAAQEDQSKQTAILKDWFIDLNMRGAMVVVLQHAGKSGDFLGDSSQIHILDAVLKLKRPGNYKKSQGLRVIVEIQKNRYECSQPKWLAPFEVQLQVTPEDGAQWTTRPAFEAQREAAFQMFRNRMKPSEVAIELGIHRSTAYRYYSQYGSQPDAKRWTDQDQDEE